jgi:hypothetical protein
MRKIQLEVPIQLALLVLAKVTYALVMWQPSGVKTQQQVRFVLESLTVILIGHV